jgi:MerR HTH family regulatory protein
MSAVNALGGIVAECHGRCNTGMEPRTKLTRIARVYLVGDLALAAACSADTVRRLERKGVIGPAVRSARGVRLFSERDLRALLAYRKL